MKRFCVLLSILAILNMGVSIADAQRWIPDTNLRTAVRETLDLADGDRLTKAAMRDLTELSAPSSEISDLTGLEFATNLIALKLNGNSISDLSPLSGLENLTGLHIWSNDITDLSPLADMTQLEVLRFTKNSVSDLSALAGLVNLKRLSLKSNSVSDVSPLSGLESLEILHLARNPITNTGALADLVSNLTEPLDIVVFRDVNLEKLVRKILKEEANLADNQVVTPELMIQLTRVVSSSDDGRVQSLSGLEYATNLEVLDVRFSGVVKRSLTPLEGLAHLSRLELKGETTELNVLLTLPSLTVFTLNDAGITDATRIGQLTDLEKLDLAFNRLKDLTVLASLENLTHLHLDANTADINDRTASNSLSDISPLANLENLEVLNLTWNAITDISPLVGMTSLTQLRLTHNAITNLYLLYPLTQQNPPVDVDITVLNGPAVEVPDENLAAALRSEIGLTVGADITEVDMRAVTSLIVKDRSITDLTGLEYTTNLTTLNLDNNNISDLSPLSALENLTHLYLWSNDITDVEPLRDMTQLELLRFTDNSVSDVSALAGLVNLKSLQLKNNRVSDVEPLTRLESLEDLQLEGNPISDPSLLYPLTQQDPPVDIDIEVRSRVVDVPDAVLAAALRNVLGLAEDADITEADMQGVTSLFITSSQIVTDLTGLEYAINLTTFSYVGGRNGEGELSDLSPLQGLSTLKDLRIFGHRQLTDFTPLQGLVNLENLDLQVNANLSDLTPLSGLVNLKNLYLTTNNISDVSPLSSLSNLEALALGRNNISDVSPLSSLSNLEWLQLSDNSVIDVSSLSGLVSLKTLDLVGNPILDTSPLYPLTQLDRPVDIDIEVVVIIEVPDTNLAAALRSALDLEADADITSGAMETLTGFTIPLGQFIGDLTGMEYAINLTSVAFSGGPNVSLTDLSPLQGLTSLTSLILSGHSELTDITPLSGLVNLERLDLQENGNIIDISALSGLINLKELSLYDNSIIDISGLSNLSDLTSLSLSNNAINDVSALSGLSNLETLTLVNNSISDVSGLSGLVNLTRLHLVGNPILDTSPLYPLTQLDPPVDIDIEVIVPEVVSVPDTNLAAALRRVFGLASDADITSGAMATLTGSTIPLGRFIGDLTGMEYAINLTSVAFLGGANVSLTDLSPLQGLTSLTTLILIGHTQLTDLTPLSGLVNLERLHLQENGNINDISALSGLISLKVLDLYDNSVNDISGLSNLSDLTDLYLSNNAINDVNALSGLLNLEVLSLVNNSIVDVNPLSGLVNLRRLRLEGNPVLDTSPLYPLTQLDPPVYIDIEVIESVIVEVPDTNLAATLRSALGLEVDADITSGDMARLTILTTSPERVLKDITGLEYAINLTWLFCELGSQSFTASLSETESLSDLSPLQGLTSLTYLSIVSYYHLTDISPLADLANLTGLTLSWSNISDLTVLSGLSNLTHLYLNNNNISDVSALEDMTNLSELRLKGNPILDTSPLYPLTQQDPPVDIDIKVMESVIVEVPDTNLAFSLRDTLGLEVDADITSGDMARLTSLTTATFSTVTSDLTGLEYAINLTQLFAQLGNQSFTVSLSETESLSDLSPLEGLTSLTLLSITSYYHLTDISPLADLVNLEYLKLSWNNISDLTVLSGLSNLTYLYLDNNNISDVSALEDLMNLSELSLEGNPILDTSPLYPLTQQDPPVDIDIAVSQYAPWDVDEDGNVDVTDTALVTAALGQSGADIVNSRTDVNGDDTVDAADLLLVTEHLDDAENASPATLSAIVNLVDTATLESLDRNVLQAQLQILRTESDGSVKYQNAIALLEAFLVATRPEETVLLANYPNPFNPETWIPYHLANASNVRITLYDTRGVVVRRLDLGHQREGYYTSRSRAAYWDGRNHVGERVASGIYFYELAADDISRLRKMVILK